MEQALVTFPVVLGADFALAVQPSDESVLTGGDDHPSKPADIAR